MAEEGFGAIDGEMTGVNDAEMTGVNDGEMTGVGPGMELDADSLVEVFSHLPQKDLCEVMLVSKYWGKAVREADMLWKKVEVVRKWDLAGAEEEGVGGAGPSFLFLFLFLLLRVAKDILWKVVEVVWKWDLGGAEVEGVGGAGPPFLSRVLRVAEEVSFSSVFDHAEEHVKWVGGVLSPMLSSLEFPANCVHTPFLTSLESNCHHLKSLVMKGDPKGKDLLRICHPNLETLDFFCQTARSLTLDCPNLTHLSIRGDEDGDRPLSYSLNCPQLTSLSLSSIHSSPRVLESMAAHSPNITWLEVDCGGDWPFDALTRFGNVRHLCLNRVHVDIPHLATQWPHLETLRIRQVCEVDLQVRHPSLRDLNQSGPTCHGFDCPSLENLTLLCRDFAMDFLENLNVMCPHLKKIEIRRVGVTNNDPQGPLRFFHETVEELKLFSKQHIPMKIVCPKLGKLVLGWVGTEKQEPRFEMECPSLTTLDIFGYHIESCLSPILLALPSLKFLFIVNTPVESTEIVLEHSHVEFIMIARSKMDKLRLVMPSLVRACLVDSRVRVLQVTSREVVTLETGNCREKGEKVKTVIRDGNMVTLNLSE